MAKSLLSIEGLKTFFFTPNGTIKAVDDVNLQISEGETVALVGESGSGKTVTGLSILRLISDPPGRIVDGKISLRNKDLLKLSKKEIARIRGSEISMIFQDPMTYLNPVAKVGNQVREAIILHQKLSKPAAKTKAVESLKTVRIAEPERVYNYYPHQLSGGMGQRIITAIALACNPHLIIADEPTTALDVTIQAQILSLLKKIIKDLGTSLLLISHDFGIVASIVDTVYVMYVGKIMEHGDVFSIYEKPMHPYTQGLLRSVLSIDEFKKNLVTIGGMVPDALRLPSGCRFHPRCPEVKEICERQQPPETEVEKNHFVSCWLYL